MSRTISSTGRLAGESVTAALVVSAAAAWWLTTRLDRDMKAAAGGNMSEGITDHVVSMPPAMFLLGWTLMMAAMMLPAVTPVVRLYQRAAASGRVAPTGWFVAAYLALWVVSGLPALVLWNLTAPPLDGGETWALRLAGMTLLLAGAYQLTPSKSACLQHCRSPMGYFMRLHGSLDRAGGAFRAGAQHATFCIGCCAALMVVLVATAAMNLWWALIIAVCVFVERNVSWGRRFSRGLGVLLAALGAAVVLSPPVLSAMI